MRTTLGSCLVPAVLAAVIWIVITFATGGSAVFAIVGGIACGAVVFVIGYGFRRLVLARRKPVDNRSN